MSAMTSEGPERRARSTAPRLSWRGMRSKATTAEKSVANDVDILIKLEVLTRTIEII